MTGARRARAGAVLGGVAAGAGVLVAQALWTTRRDLPSVTGIDASGAEGDSTGPTVVVAALGDSTLTGPGLADPGDIWVRQAARAVAGHNNIVIRSFAVGGSRVADVARTQIPAMGDLRPDVVVLAVGSNDAIHHTNRRAVEREYAALLGELTRRAPVVIAGGVGDLGAIARVPWPLSVYVRAIGRRVNRVLRRVARSTPGVVYLDTSITDGAFRHGGSGLFTVDLFHPNEVGHGLWAELAAPVLREAIGLRCAPPHPHATEGEPCADRRAHAADR